MIISVEEAKKYLATTESDEVLEGKLQALELLIRGYTNNNFQYRNVRFKADVKGNQIENTYVNFFKVNDTLEISQSQFNNGLYVVKAIEDSIATIDKDLYEEEEVLVTKVVYPKDVQLGALNMLKWDLDNRSKVGIASESISRHSVTYLSLDGTNTLIGYPSALVGFLKPYIKARF